MSTDKKNISNVLTDIDAETDFTDDELPVDMPRDPDDIVDDDDEIDEDSDEAFAKRWYD
jgi:hypothetical protein